MNRYRESRGPRYLEAEDLCSEGSLAGQGVVGGLEASGGHGVGKGLVGGAGEATST